MSPYTTRVCFQGPPGPPGPPGEQVCFLIGMVCIPSFILLPWMPAKSHDIPFIISVPDSKRKCSIAERCFYLYWLLTSSCNLQGPPGRLKITNPDWVRSNYRHFHCYLCKMLYVASNVISFSFSLFVCQKKIHTHTDIQHLTKMLFKD